MSIASNQVSNSGGLAGYNPSYVWGGAPSWMQTGNAAAAQGLTTNDPNMSFGGTQYDPTNGLAPGQTIDPATLQALQARGWTGGNPIAMTQGGGQGQDGGTPTSTYGLSPQFQQWAAQNGITAADFQQADQGGNNQVGLGFYGSNSTGPTNGQIGDTSSYGYGNDQGFMTAADLAAIGITGGLAGGYLGGAGAADAAGASSSDLAALYGDAGYGGGASSLGDVGSVTGFSTGGANASILPAGYSAPTGFSVPGSSGTLGQAFGDTSSLGLGGPVTDAGSGFTDAGASYPTFGGGSGAGFGTGTTGGYGSAGGSSILSSLGLSPNAAGAAGSGLSALLGAGASLYGANLQSKAAGNAANLLAAQQAQTNANEAPYLAAGKSALGTIGDLMGTSGNTGAAGYGSLNHQFNASDLNSNLAPNYQFQLQAGNQATQQAASAAGFTGNTLNAINQYSQNTAAGAYQQAFNNYTTNQTNIYNRLANLAGLGQVGTQTQAQTGAGAAAGQAGYNTSGAAANAAGIVGGVNSINNGLNNVTGWNYLSGTSNPGKSVYGP